MNQPLTPAARALDRATVLGYLAGVAITSVLWIAAELLLGGAA